MEMRIASINLDSLDFGKLDGIQEAFPIPMPVLAKKSSDEVFLIYSLFNKIQWSKQASLNQEINVNKSTGIPLEIPSAVFADHFMPLGGKFDGTGIYGKIPSPVISLKVDVPCSYSNNSALQSVEPNSVVIRTQSGIFRHYSSEDFNRMFVNNLKQLENMHIKINKLSNENNHIAENTM